MTTIFPSAGFEISLPESIETDYLDALHEWGARDSTRRLWEGDSSLWTGADEGDWLGWLEPGGGFDLMDAGVVANELTDEGMRDVVVLGMGGSSLGAALLGEAIPRLGATIPEPSARALLVLDSTDPSEIRRFEDTADLERCLFVVASKSGGTLETTVLGDYFHDRMSALVGERAGRHFVAITDEGSQLERVARERGFRAVFRGTPGIGGRFSVLSAFGLAPAVLCARAVSTVLDGARAMARRCAPGTPEEENPSVALGILLAVLAKHNRSLLAIDPETRLPALGDWIEQLVAESTGKQGLGLLPLTGHAALLGSEEATDRCVVRWKDSSLTAGSRAECLITLSDGGAADVGGEIFRWQFATAVACARLGVHAFVQPDVESAKAVTRRLTADYEGGRFLPAECLIGEDETMQGFAAGLDGPLEGLGELLSSLCFDSNREEFVAVLAWMERSAAVEELLARLRAAIAERSGVATSLGFGPRYLHSTGQYFKAGPNRGRFLLLTCEEKPAIPIPSRRYDFAALESAQARGDFEVLAERGRRVLQVHFSGEPLSGLERLCRAAEKGEEFRISNFE